MQEGEVFSPGRGYPGEAIKPMPHWFDKPLRVQSMDRFRGVTGICMKVQPPSSCGMPLVTAAWCGFLRDGIEGRWEREAGVGQAKDVQPEMQETGEGVLHENRFR